MSGAARSLFLLHFKRIVIPLLSVTVMLYVPSLVVTRIYQSVLHIQRSDADHLMNAFSVVLLVMALPVGTAAFSRQFKEQHILFFHSLPLSRSAAWFALVGAAFAALIVTAIGLAAVRPAAFTTIPENLLGAYLATFVITFAIGSAAGLAFTRPVEVYIAAYLCAFLMLTAGLLAVIGPALILTDAPRAVSVAAVDTLFSLTRYSPAAATCLTIAAFAAVGFLAASHFFYVRGEMTHGRRRLLNPLMLLGLVAAVALVIAPLLVEAFALRAPLERARIALSRDGHYALLTRGNASVPWRVQLRVIDLTSGNRRPAFSADGLVIDPVWMGGDRIALVRRDVRWWRRPPLAMTPRDLLQIYSVDGGLLAQTTLHDEIVRDIAPDPSGDSMLLGLRHEDEARVMEWRSDGSLRELVRAAGVKGIAVGLDTAWASRGTGPAHVWSFAGGQSRELPIRGAAEQQNPTFVRGNVYATPEIAAGEIDRTMPAPRAAGERALYALGGWWADVPYVFAVVPHPGRHLASVAVLGGEAWKTISNAVPIREDETFKSAEKALYQNDLSALHINRASGVISYVARNGEEEVVRLFDPRSGKDFELRRLPAGHNAAGFALLEPNGSHLIRVAGGGRWPNRKLVAELVYRDGVLTPIERRGDGLLALLAPDGTQIRGVNAFTLSVAPPGGAVRLIDLK